jgi:FtsZ-binding cell division protein ZapB
MKKGIVLSLAVIGSLAYGVEISDSDLAAIKAEIAALKAEVKALKEEANAKSSQKKQIASLRREVNELKKSKEEDSEKLEAMNESLTAVKTHDSHDNLKWGADLRTAVDYIGYKMADGSKRSNHNLFSTRLWLNMAYNPSDHDIFFGQLSYNKAFGADYGNMRGWGFDSMDWVTNEALAGNDLKVRQAYWLHKGDTLFGADIPWTASVGRRPATEGFLANFREDDKALSPLGHIINMEFDGGSVSVNLENVTDISGMNFKVCAGRGATNAKPMFDGRGTSYDEDKNVLDQTDLLGLIFVPYDDGQYTIKTTYFHAWDLPGFRTPASLNMNTLGDMDGAAISMLIDGLMEDTFLEETKFFASFAWSKTHPRSGEQMLGSTGDESGTSFWVGIQQPLFGGDIGLEFNHGSKYWRSFTYGEDTMIGSKLAARGNAYEAYYTYHMTDALTFQLRYTYIDYKYAGSNGFFGATGTPVSVDSVKGTPAAANIVDTAQDVRAYIRYRF